MYWYLKNDHLVLCSLPRWTDSVRVGYRYGSLPRRVLPDSLCLSRSLVGSASTLDRIPEVRTLRAKLKLLCQDLGQAMRWNAILAKEWIARQNATELYFYCDGHVRVYHGDQTALPRHYVARERLCLRATTDYWINAMDGQPFLYVNKEVD